MTLLKNDKQHLPLQLNDQNKILIYDIFSKSSSLQTSLIAIKIRDACPATQIISINATYIESIKDDLFLSAEKVDLVLWNIFLKPDFYSGKIGIPTILSQVLRRVREFHKPIIAISFGNPYIYSSIPYVDAYLCAYDDGIKTQTAVYEALLGQASVSGKLPVLIPGHFKL